MKRVRGLGFVGCSFVITALAGCATQPSAEPLSPSDAPEPASSYEADAPESAPHPSGKRAPCTFGQDQTCNSDPKVSALWGKCLETGVCECQAGFELNPMGSCAPVK